MNSVNIGSNDVFNEKISGSTVREQAAFAAGIETARQVAMTAAVSIEVRDDAGDLRQRAAAAALQGLADGLKATFLTPPTKPEE